MKALEEKIVKEGVWLPGNILKVGSFLNHQIDGKFMMELGEEIARLFAQEKIDRILTIETSGIPLAMAASVALGVPMVFAKKNRTSNLSGPAGERVLLVDDFLANGRALMGLMELVNQAGSQTVGAVAAIEKGFQKGGDLLRSQGLRVEALALIDSMDNGNLVFRR